MGRASRKYVVITFMDFPGSGVGGDHSTVINILEAAQPSDILGNF
jgi:hypothetical protein